MVGVVESGALMLKITLHADSVVTKCGKTFENNVRNSFLLVFLFLSTVEKVGWIRSNQIFSCMPPFIFRWFVVLLLRDKLMIFQKTAKAHLPDSRILFSITVLPASSLHLTFSPLHLATQSLSSSEEPTVCHAPAEERCCLGL